MDATLAMHSLARGLWAVPALLAMVAALAGSAAALAQTPPPATRPNTQAAQPGQIERQFQPLPQPRSQGGGLQVPLPRQDAPPGSEGVRFRLTELTLEGVTVYPSDSWGADFNRLLGRRVALADIYAFAAALTTRYRNDGYILSQVIVPAQTVDDGRVRLQAIEGYIAQVRFEGEAPGNLLKAHAEQIRAERPLKAATLERFLLLMNDQPGTLARALLAPSATQSGASDLVIQLSRERFSAGFSADNRGGRSLGPWRGTLELEQRALLGWGDRTSARLVGAERNELQYLALAHEEAIGGDGTRGSLSFSRVRARPDTGDSFIALDLRTESDTLALTMSYALKRSRSENAYLRAALTGHNGTTFLFDVVDTEDRIRALRLGLTYDLADAWRGVNLLDIEVAGGFEGMGSSRAGDALLSRANGQPAFVKLSAYAARLQALAPGWALLAALSAQQAFDDLLAPELYSFGGEPFGRGYDPSELVGDHGAAAKLELRHTRAFDAIGLNATFYGFYDAGTVRQRSPQGLAAKQSATSAGLGVRFDRSAWLSGYLEWAKPLTRDVAAEGNRDGRFYAGLSLRY
jgi:hemolysin activation/secretion protein